jgi:hypothetical protein
MRGNLLSLTVTLSLLACASADGLLDKARTANRSNLIQLQLGMDRETVLRTMGTKSVVVKDGTEFVGTINNPYRTEMYQVDADTFEVIFYYTDLKGRDGAITDDELTPLLLKNGVLIGWGWSHLRDVAAKYEIRFR